MHVYSGERHDETVGSSLVPVYYPLLHRTNRYPDKQGIDTTLIDIHNTFAVIENLFIIAYETYKIFGMGTDSDFYDRYT